MVKMALFMVVSLLGANIRLLGVVFTRMTQENGGSNTPISDFRAKIKGKVVFSCISKGAKRKKHYLCS